MAQIFMNNAAGKLAVAIDEIDNSLVLELGDGARFPSPTGGDFFLATLVGSESGQEVAWEIVKVTGRVGDTFNVERGQEGTVARGWPVETRVELRLTAGTIKEIADSANVQTVQYEDRGQLRLIDGGNHILVDGLGLFTWYSGSDEPDDDESCFATASGRWLLEAVHWDVVGAWLAPDWDESQSADEDLRAATQGLQAATQDLQGKFLTATFDNTVSSVSANTTTTATVTVSGAEVGDAVIVTRSGQHTSRPEGNVYGVVTSAETVTVYLCADNVTVYFHVGTWRVTVIKP